ncbi:MAG: FecR domain-containing protein [Arenicellales bacterium]|nr:FecR domain-containing protein [Arenicellales bacterium]
MNIKGRAQTSLIVFGLLCLPHGADAATDEVEVGVTAASVIDAKGKPPVSPARDLETGLEVFFNEKISTDDTGRAQLLFRDGTSLTVGAGSEMTIDEYVFDPDTGTGEMVVSISKGVFRLVGGKISKNTPVVFNSPSATVSVRGGIAYVKETTAGLEAGLLYGTQLSVTSAASGLTASTSQTGRAFSVSSGQTTAPTAQKISPETLAKDLAALEKPVDQPAPAAADEPSGASDQQAGSAQPEDSGQEPAPVEGDQANAASQPEPSEKPADEGVASESGLARTEPDPNQPPPEEAGLVVREGSPDGLLPGTNESSPEPGTEPQRLAPMTPGEPGEAVADGSMMPPPMPGNPEDLAASPEGLTQPVEIGAPPIPKAGMAANIPVAAAPPAGGIPNMPVAPAGLKLEINSLAVDFSNDVAAYVPPVGSPIGRAPSRTPAEPAMAMVDMTKAVDDTVKAPGVRTEDGKSVTAPTGGWETSAAYSFTGATAEEKPAYFEPKTADTGTTATTASAAADRCDPDTEYCPSESEKAAGTTKPKPAETVKVETTTTSCDPAKGCKKVADPPKYDIKSTSAIDSGATDEDGTTSTSCDAEGCKRIAVADPPKYDIKSTSAIDSGATDEDGTTSTSCDPAKGCRKVIKSDTKSPPKTKTRVSRTGSAVPTVATGIFTSGDEFALTSSVGQENAAMHLVGDQIPLCKECRFLKWYRSTTSITGTSIFAAEIQHWILGAASTASELSAAAGKTASYSGGLVGAVATSGFIQEKTGSFDARVRFGVSQYQVQNFNAAFDGSRYTGTSGPTSNDTLFSVTGHSGAQVMRAGGYFFGSPTRGKAPPEMGGHFEVTGDDYHAAGVFAGSQH